MIAVRNYDQTKRLIGLHAENGLVKQCFTHCMAREDPDVAIALRDTVDHLHGPALLEVNLYSRVR